MMACLPMNDKVVDITQSTETADAPKTKVYRSMIGNGRISPATRQRVLDYVKNTTVPSMYPPAGRIIVARTTFHW